jgi:2-phosphosulfolactate phosphatase
MSSGNISVVFRKENIAAAFPAVKGCAAVVIDVLRATSTIVTALGNGAARIVPAATPDEARDHAAKLPAGSFLLGGERGGVKIDGFDLGNSPREYSTERVRGKTIVFTTTNGTEALRACTSGGAASVWIGSLLNIEPIVDALLEISEDIVLVCAGTEGVQGIDDAYAAGALVEALLDAEDFELDDSAQIAVNHFRAAGTALIVLQTSLGGRNLKRVGLDSDIEDCDGSRAMFDIAPQYFTERNEVNFHRKDVKAQRTTTD